MSTEYFFVKPSCFSRLGNIDIDGNMDYVKCEDFKVKDEHENFILLEVRYDEFNGEKLYPSYAKEIITGKKFDMHFYDKKGAKTNEDYKTVIITNESLGLYSTELLLDDIERKPIKVSGLFYYLIDNEEEKVNYCKCLKEMFEEAAAHKYISDHTIDGPSTYLKNQIKKIYRKIE